MCAMSWWTFAAASCKETMHERSIYIEGEPIAGAAHGKDA